VTVKDLQRLGGYSLLNKYQSSPSRLFSTVYPEYEWLPWKFDHCPQKYWNSVNNQKQFLDWAGKQFQYKEMSDWYNVSVKVNASIRSLLIL
jgi:hypothetical protein